MLAHLTIQNYALITKLDIDFQEGFTVLTGETGAGKSIILGALALVMGARADTRTITDGEQRCIIEAIFTTDDGETLIRRELNRNGRSRSFINDEIVTQNELQGLSALLIDIHSQHQNLMLGNDDFQLSIVDALADNHKEKQAYLKAFNAFNKADLELRKLKKAATDAAKDADYIEYQYNQLHELNLQMGEMQELEEEQYRLSHAEEIREAYMQASEAINGDNGSALSILRQIRLDAASSELQERLRSAIIELDDIADETYRGAEHTESDPARLMEVEQRLDIINTLLRKHGVGDADELIAIHDRLGELLDENADYSDRIKDAEKILLTAHKQMEETASLLTKTRQTIAPSIAKQLMERLNILGIAHAAMEVAVTPLEEYAESGHDDVQFLFAANLGQTLRSVADVASGGEIARIMLCIKALIASTNGLPTIIFDEIDTGVSGEVAARMGEIMREMASNRQIIAISHLPQIAAAAEHQMLVYKADTATRTETHIRPLNEDERPMQIATLLSGANPSAEAITTAKQMLSNYR